MDDEIDRFIAEEEDDAYEEQLEYLDEQQEGDVSPVGLSEHEKNLSGWGRPALESQSTGDTRIAFQQLEVDYCAGKPDKRFAASSQQGLYAVPIVRIYGVTEKGHSACAFVHGFEPYFYVRCANSRQNMMPDDLPAFKEALNQQVMSRGPKAGGSQQRAIVRVEIVKAKSIWHYQPGSKDTFYKITCSMPNLRYLRMELMFRAELAV